MFIEKEAYLQEYNRRDLIQRLEAKKLANSVPNPRLESRVAYSLKISHLLQVLHERVRAFIGMPKVA